MNDRLPDISSGLAEVLAPTSSFDDAAGQIVQFALHATGTSFGGITLVHGEGKRFETVAATAPQVERADHLQYELREGPCVDAAVESRSVASSDLASDERWSQWGPAAAELGFRSILSSELHARGQRIGALNLYGDHEAEFTDFDVELAKQLATQASGVLGYARQVTQLQNALNSRTVIGQAEGILMERFGIDEEKAFAVLRRYSQTSNERLHAICQELVRTRKVP